jgi:hypothetical protein
VCLLCGTFCPHSVFMCFVCIWEQTAIISLHSINWLVFITETECVYCAVGTESWNVIQVNLVVVCFLVLVHNVWQCQGQCTTCLYGLQQAVTTYSHTCREALCNTTTFQVTIAGVSAQSWTDASHNEVKVIPLQPTSSVRYLSKQMDNIKLGLTYYGRHFAEDKVQNIAFVDSVVNCWMPTRNTCKPTQTFHSSRTVFRELC